MAFAGSETVMKLLLIAAVGLLSFANGANDNFKGVATLWGAGRTSYKRALAWATAFTFLGSLTAAGVAGELAEKFNGSNLVSKEIATQLPFLGAVILAAAGTVLLASRLGLPISTTHALVGALAGAGVTAAGFAHVQFAALGRGIILPLLISPVAALLLTLGVYPLVRKLSINRDCVCVDEPIALTAMGAVPSANAMAAVAVAAAPSVRWANAEECDTGVEARRFSVTDTLHWLSGAAISFARGLNDTPKIAAVLLVSLAGAAMRDYALVAVAMAIGGILGAARVAKTMSQRITPMAAPEAMGANLVSAALVLAASRWGLPVSTTHVTTGSVFGIGLLQRDKADWRRVREIVLSWVATLPMGAALAFAFYKLLAR
jgi:PiT family inorganic phosphate transporter